MVLYVPKQLALYYIRQLDYELEISIAKGDGGEYCALVNYHA